MAKELDKVTEWIVYREKRKAGQLKDNFNQILKNLDEPNRRRLSQRLNELLPWVEEKVRAINMLPKLIDNYYRHDHVGDILKSFGVYWWVAWWFWWWIPWAIAWAVWWYFLGNAFNKLKKARWEKALSKLSEQGQERLAEITEKIQNKEELSTAEKNYIKAIWKNIEEWNFKENQVSSKTATKQDVFDWLVESIESITDEANQYTDADIKVMEQYLEESRKDLSENDYKNLKEFLNYQKNEYEIAKGEKEFYESWEAQRIINWEDEKAVKDFQSRILRIENEEKNVGKVAGKKVNRAYAEQQQRNLEAKRERLIEEIWEYYWIDQFEAADKYDQLRDSANVNKVKFQVAEPTTSKAFKDWFWDWENDPKNASKIVDESWKPLVAYHWTHWDFTIFDKEKIWSNTNNEWLFGKWFYFTTDSKYWDYYKWKWWSKDRVEWKTMQVYLDIKNPFMWNDYKWPQAIEKLRKELWLPKSVLEWNNHWDNGIHVFTKPEQSRRFTEALEKAWYDWVWFKYDNSAQDEIVAFNSNQIKSATDNVWTFDKNNPDIRFQKYWTAGQWEKWVTAAEWLNIRNFKNWKSVQELADTYWIKTNIVDSISTPTGQKAYWMYWDRVITLARDLKESTVPHELLHATFDMVDQTKKNQILDGIKERLKVDDVQAEEWLADNFSEYYRTGKFDTKAIPTTFVWKVKQFFQQIKEYIDWTYANRKEIQNLFDDIIDGKLEWEYWVYSDPKFQSVWHGSHAKFDRFDSSHMWEWEWAQIHWWWHYVAVNEWTARKYAELKERIGWKLAPRFTLDGKELKDWIKNLSDLEKNALNQFKDAVEWWVVEDIAWNRIINRDNSQIELWEKILKHISEKIKDKPEKKQYYDEMAADVKKDLKEYKDRKSTLESLRNRVWVDINRKNLYNVEIPDPIKKDTPTWSNYLEEWDFIAPEIADEFTKKVLESWLEVHDWSNPYWVKKLMDSYKWWSENKVSVKNLYHVLQTVLGSDKKASKFLESLWYDGIHYFWGRDWEAYVIFNDDALKINSHEQF